MSESEGKKGGDAEAAASGLPSASVHFLFFLLSHCLIGDNQEELVEEQNRRVLLFTHDMRFLSHRLSALLSWVFLSRRIRDTERARGSFKPSRGRRESYEDKRRGKGWPEEVYTEAT